MCGAGDVESFATCDRSHIGRPVDLTDGDVVDDQGAVEAWARGDGHNHR
jgi:hypothetical protein